MAMQFKTLTQMTQMTQGPPAGPPLAMLAPACSMRALAMAAGMRRHGRRQYPQC
jgi:hypothetical protein